MCHIPSSIYSFIYSEAGSHYIAQDLTKLLKLALNLRFSCLKLWSCWYYRCGQGGGGGMDNHLHWHSPVILAIWEEAGTTTQVKASLSNLQDSK